MYFVSLILLYNLSSCNKLLCLLQVLLVWDDGEVRKILTAAQWVLDRLVLVKGAKSMRGLVICFGVSG